MGQSKKKASHVATVVLAVLSRRERLRQADIWRAVRSSHPSMRSLDRKYLYGQLGRLADEGLLEGEDGPASPLGGKERSYRITEEGQVRAQELIDYAMADLFDEKPHQWVLRFSHLLDLLFAAYPSGAREVAFERIKVCLELLDLRRREILKLSPDEWGDADQLHWAKALVGHLLDVEELHLQRLLHELTPSPSTADEAVE